MFSRTLKIRILLILVGDNPELTIKPSVNCLISLTHTDNLVFFKFRNSKLRLIISPSKKFENIAVF